MALAHCILGKFSGVGCYYFPSPLDVPTYVASCLHVHDDARDPSSERWNCGREMLSSNFAKMTIFTPLMDLLHAANLRHGTNGFTSPKEGILRIFSPLKLRWLQPGLNPLTWVLKASTLPLDHRSHCSASMVYKRQVSFPASANRKSCRICGVLNKVADTFTA
jgi:hypothetical protein